jgi:hypothetical protein
MEIIREIINEDDLKNSVRVIRDSFSTVAVEFGLTHGNCPTHPLFTTIQAVRKCSPDPLGSGSRG